MVWNPSMWWATIQLWRQLSVFVLRQWTERSWACSTPCPGLEGGAGRWLTRRRRPFWETACCSTARSSEPPLNLVIYSKSVVVSVITGRFCWRFVLFWIPPLSSARCTVGAGGALSGVGEALHQVARARDALDVNVKGTFVDPLQGLHDAELKEIRVRSLFQVQLWFHLSSFCSGWFCSISWRRWTVGGWSLTTRGDEAGKSQRERSSRPGESLWAPKSWQRGACVCCCRMMWVTWWSTQDHRKLIKGIQPDQVKFTIQIKEPKSAFWALLLLWFPLKVDQLRILASLVTALLAFHHNAHRILLGLHGNLQMRQVHIQCLSKVSQGKSTYEGHSHSSYNCEKLFFTF